LIAYDREVNAEASLRREREHLSPCSARGIPDFTRSSFRLSAALCCTALVNRAPFTVNVIHDRDPIFVRLSDGHIRNAYTMRIANFLTEERTFTLSVHGLDHAKLDVIGNEKVIDGNPAVTVGPAIRRANRARSAHADGRGR